jgi:biopolymer transport protein ExbD
MASIVFVGPEWFLPAALPDERTRDEPQSPDPFALPDPTLSVRVSLTDGIPSVTGLGPGTVALENFEAHTREQLAGANAETIKIRLSAEGGVPWQHVVTTQDILTRVGIRQIALDTAAN